MDLGPIDRILPGRLVEQDALHLFDRVRNERIRVGRVRAGDPRGERRNTEERELHGDSPIDRVDEVDPELQQLSLRDLLREHNDVLGVLEELLDHCTNADGGVS